MPGAPRTLANGINDHGQIVGAYENPTRTQSLRGASPSWVRLPTGLRRSRVCPDLCSSEADFDKIKTVRATTVSWEGAAGSRHDAKPPPTLRPNPCSIY